MDKETADTVFQHLWLTCWSSVQLSTAVLMCQSRDAVHWMPQFLAETMQRTLASDAANQLVPKDRVFVTLLHMALKTMEQQQQQQQQQQSSNAINLLDPVLSLLNSQLSILEGDNVGVDPLALSHLDLPLVNWLLLFCCCCLDKTVAVSRSASKLATADSAKGVDQRWDFLQGEFVDISTESMHISDGNIF